MKTKQQNLIQKNSSGLVHGGEYRKHRRGRGARPLTTKHSHHIVFKINPKNLLNRSFRHPKNFKFVQFLLNRYAKRFFVKIEQISYQHNHIHIMARCSRRTNFHHFFRVFAGQIAQNLKVKIDIPKETPRGVTDTPTNDREQGCTRRGAKMATALWPQRPFSRIVRGWKNYLTLRNYIQLNELEVNGVIPYQKNRTRNMSRDQLERLWLMGGDRYPLGENWSDCTSAYPRETDTPRRAEGRSS